MKRIALFLPNWIGDVVMATPAIRAMRERFPSADLIAVCKPYVADVLSGSPWFQDVVLFDKNGPRERRMWAIARKLRHQGCDAAILFPNSFRTALLARLGGCRNLIGFARYGRGFLLSKRLRACTDSRGRITPSPVIDDYNRLAVTLGTVNPGHRMELFTTAADESQADAVWQQFGLHRYDRVIGLNPGAAFGAAKHWPVQHFARLAQQLTQRPGVGVLVLCGPTEREMAKRIAAVSRSAAVHSMSDNELSLGLTKALIRRLELLVTTDSGPRHFAAAFDVPVVSLFGPTFIEWTETYFEKAINLQERVPCGPCQQRTCHLDHRCMRDLLPERVFSATDRLLSHSPSAEVRHAG